MRREKTYRRYMKRIEKLIEIDPKPHTKNGKELARLVRAVEIYESIHFPITHSDRRLRADLIDLGVFKPKSV